jgi:hypothetical protein
MAALEFAKSNGWINIDFCARQSVIARTFFLRSQDNWRGLQSYPAAETEAFLEVL